MHGKLPDRISSRWRAAALTSRRFRPLTAHGMFEGVDSSRVGRTYAEAVLLGDLASCVAQLRRSIGASEISGGP
jgi:hypothetical protein